MKPLVIFFAMALGGGDAQAEFTREVQRQLAWLYRATRVEFVVCGYGSVRGDTVRVERVELPTGRLVSTARWVATGWTCPSEPLAVIHSHSIEWPGYDPCKENAHDRAFLERQEPPRAVDIVICGTRRQS